jgi:hypothetical protein
MIAIPTGVELLVERVLSLGIRLSLSESLSFCAACPEIDKGLADISVGDERTSISKTNGKDAVNLQIMKSQDANTVQGLAVSIVLIDFIPLSLRTNSSTFF